MSRQVTLASLVAGFVVIATAPAFATPTTYSGVTFPDGDISFADEIVSFNPGADVGAPYDDASRTLGAPDGLHLSLGDGGSVIVRFTNNSLTTSGDATPDLHIFEVGGVVEKFNVSISQDLINWINLGDLSGQPTSIDIDSVVGVIPFALYSYVRLIDVAPNQTGFPFGEADIDAIGAISSAPPVSAPAPGALGLLSVGLLGAAFRKKRA